MTDADDALFDRLGRALDEDAPAEPPADRLAALRAHAERGSAPPTVSPIAPRPPLQVTTTPQRTVVAPAPVRASRRPWIVAAAAVVALVAGFTVARLGSGDDGDETAGDTEYDGTMTGPDGTALDAELTVVATGIGRVVDLQTGELPILPAGEYYEVWFVAPTDTPEARDRISAGTFHPDPDGRSDVRFAAAVDPALYPLVEVTAEPGDGDPSPTGPVVLRADLNA